MVLFLSDSCGQLKRFQSYAITNRSVKTDNLGRATTIMGVLFLSLDEVITISILALYVVWLPSGFNYRMVFVGASS